MLLICVFLARSFFHHFYGYGILKDNDWMSGSIAIRFCYLIEKKHNKYMFYKTTNFKFFPSLFIYVLLKLIFSIDVK